MNPLSSPGIPSSHRNGGEHLEPDASVEELRAQLTAAHAEIRSLKAQLRIETTKVNPLLERQPTLSQQLPSSIEEATDKEAQRMPESTSDPTHDINRRRTKSHQSKKLYMNYWLDCVMFTVGDTGVHTPVIGSVLGQTIDHVLEVSLGVGPPEPPRIILAARVASKS
ncbi:MAG: hypothetical protein Q9222_003424, partial [Ikaeria aurantiellina]